MENKGIFAISSLNKTGYFIKKSIARKVKRPSYVPIVTPLIIPANSKQENQYGTTERSGKLCK